MRYGNILLSELCQSPEDCREPLPPRLSGWFWASVIAGWWAGIVILVNLWQLAYAAWSSLP